MDRCEAVVFDLDGTLLDTLEDLADSVNYALETQGCPKKSLAQVRSYVGNGIRNLMIRSVEGGEGHPGFEEMFQAFREHYKANCNNKTKPYPGIMEAVGRLSEKGIKLAIVSNKADFAVKELNDIYFKGYGMVAIGEREGIKRKPAPDTVCQALRELAVARERAVYVGDSEVDIETARNAGLPCISVLWGFRERELLAERGAEVFAEKPEDILRILGVGD